MAGGSSETSKSAKTLAPLPPSDQCSKDLDFDQLALLKNLLSPAAAMQQNSNAHLGATVQRPSVGAQLGSKFQIIDQKRKDSTAGSDDESVGDSPSFNDSQDTPASFDNVDSSGLMRELSANGTEKFILK